MAGVNRTNALTLGGQFGSMAGVMQASAAQLSACPGLGHIKVQVCEGGQRSIVMGGVGVEEQSG